MNASAIDKPSNVKETALFHSLYTIKALAESHLESMRLRMGNAVDKEMLKIANHSLEQTMEHASRIAEMIEHFRGRTERASESGGRIGVSLQQTVSHILHAMHYEFPFDRITILKVLPPEDELLPIASVHLETILFELIDHARRRLAEFPGVITIEGYEKSFIPSGRSDQGVFIVKVSDTGPMIDSEELKHLFDPFYYGSFAAKHQTVGLCLAKKLVELNDGMMSAESSQIGSWVQIEMPLSRGAIETAAPPSRKKRSA